MDTIWALPNFMSSVSVKFSFTITTPGVEVLNSVNTFLATAALEVQMYVSVCLGVTLATTVVDFWSEGLLKDYGLQNLLVYKSQPPGFRDLLM